MDQQEQGGSLEMRTSAVEDGMKMFEERMNAICFDFKILLAHFNTINEWISSKFGVELINKESPEYKHLCSGIEELAAISGKLSLQQRQSEREEPTMDVTMASTTAAGFGDHEEAAAAAVVVVEELDEAQGTPAEFELVEINEEGESEILVGSTSSKHAAKTKPKAVSKSKTQLSTSKITRRSKYEPYICTFCNRSIASFANLEIHMRSHTGEKPFSCAFCHREFAAAKNMTRHMKTHTGEKPFTCNICHRGFPDVTRLKVHMRSHTGEKPYGCHICYRRFSVSQRLKIHLRTHTSSEGKPPPFQCTLCSWPFTSQRSLDIHLDVHRRRQPVQGTSSESTGGNQIRDQESFATTELRSAPQVMTNATTTTVNNNCVQYMKGNGGAGRAGVEQEEEQSFQLQQQQQQFKNELDDDGKILAILPD